MATKKGIWNLQQVRDKQLQSLWGYSGLKFLWVIGGYNDNGELGQNNRTKYSSPVQVGSSGGWSTGSGLQASAAIKTDGTLWTWGLNQYGQLGLNESGSGTHKSSPVQVPGTTWSTVSANNNSMLAIKTDGTLWAWGYQAEGSLGLNQTLVHRSSPTQVGSDTTWSKAVSGFIRGWGIKTDGTLWSWGYGTYGYLGLNQNGNAGARSSPTQLPGTWKSIDDGTYHITGVKTDGTLWAWGYNANGSLGLNNTVHRSSPTQVGSDTDWDHVFCSTYNNLAVKTNGELWTWGRNDKGQSGRNDTVKRSAPIQVGSDTTWTNKIGCANATESYAIKTDGTLWSWGENQYGNLGHNNITNYSSPTQVGSETIWEGLHQGHYANRGVILIKGES